MGDVPQEFVRVRLVRITGVDLNFLEFDMDLTWAALFVSAEGRVYGRFGGRDAKGPDTRNTLVGLKYAMESALKAHRAAAKPQAVKEAPLVIDKVPSYAAYAKGGCIHCHQAKEILRVEDDRKGGWDPKSRWVFPLPENVGITLDPNQGDRVQAVAEKSPAAKAGMKPGDVIVKLNGNPVHSFADAQYALHKAPVKGSIPITWTRGGSEKSADLELIADWKKTNITWRPSLMDLLPSLPLFGADLTAKEKAAAGLSATRLAFRQEAPIPPSVKKLGVQAGDVIVGIDGQALDMTMEAFLGHVRRNYLQGDRVTLNLMRDGKKMDLQIKLP